MVALLETKAMAFVNSRGTVVVQIAPPMAAPIPPYVSGDSIRCGNVLTAM